MLRTTFADPKTDFIFKRIFGSEPHKHLLIGLLNTLLELEEGHLITEISYLGAEQKIPLEEMKLSIVDVKCVDQNEVKYVVEMQLFNVSGFEERVIYNASKAFTLQLRKGEDYHQLKGVVGVTICDFCLWPGPGEQEGPAVPMLSRWQMQEQHTQIRGLPKVQYVFLELPKYSAGPHPQELVDKWALFFREAEDLEVIPPELDCEPFREAFEIARMAQLTEVELEIYEASQNAEQNARGALEFAREEGRAEGEAKAMRQGIRDLCEVLGIDWDGARESMVDALAGKALQELKQKLIRDQRWP